MGKQHCGTDMHTLSLDLVYSQTVHLPTNSFKLSCHWSYVNSLSIPFCLSSVNLISGSYLAGQKILPTLEAVKPPMANFDKPVPAAVNSMLPACVVMCALAQKFENAMDLTSLCLFSCLQLSLKKMCVITVSAKEELAFEVDWSKFIAVDSTLNRN